MIKMYLLQREGRDDDYIGVSGGKINVHSSMLKHVWTEPSKINFNIFSFPYTLETYYGDSNILESAVLLWEHEV
jgi:hypothetical protein